MYILTENRWHEIRKFVNWKMNMENVITDNTKGDTINTSRFVYLFTCKRQPLNSTTCLLSCVRFRLVINSVRWYAHAHSTSKEITFIWALFIAHVFVFVFIFIFVCNANGEWWVWVCVILSADFCCIIRCKWWYLLHGENNNRTPPEKDCIVRWAIVTQWSRAD